VLHRQNSVITLVNTEFHPNWSRILKKNTKLQWNSHT